MRPGMFSRDYDIVYVVREISSFREDKEWIDVFGRRLYMQYPDDTPMPGEEIDTENSYGYLMQFADGNRLDLRLATLKYAFGRYGKGQALHLAFG